MKNLRRINCIVFVILCGALLIAGGCSQSNSLVVGNGCSKLKDSYQAGAEAAVSAQAALGAKKPKVVLVFDSGDIKDKDKLIDGVATVFDKSIVYGCSSYSPLTQQSNMGTVGVLAMGGDIKVTTSLAPLEGEGYESCGKAIGSELKKDAEADSPGKLLLLFGKCHVDKNDELVKGVKGEFGEGFGIVGGAAAAGEHVYYKGDVAKSCNVGILLRGNFKTSFCAIKDNSPEGLITSAGKASKQVLGENSQAQLMFAFDCGGRRGMMKDNVPKELEAMKQAAGDIPIFGFYGSGEIGSKDNESPSKGVGYHLVVCAVTAE